MKAEQFANGRILLKISPTNEQITDIGKSIVNDIKRLQSFNDIH